MILVIGDLDQWVAAGRPLPDGEIAYAVVGDLNRALLRRLSPDLVLAPLSTPAFDAFEVARRLARAGYRGPFRAVTLPLPHPDLVRDEVAAVAPDLDFDLVVIERPLN